MKLVTSAALLLAVAVAPAAPVPATTNKDGNPLPVGAVWKGRLTQKGGGPTGFDCKFTITKRDGDKFEADLYEKEGEMVLTYLVRGTIKPVDVKNKEKGFKLEFTNYGAKDVMNTSEILQVPYVATLVGKKIKGSWKLPDDSEFGALEGDFDFELEQKKD
ncbi:MAG: hypothetical protein FJ304_13750 [Planctomycetes bacterium]|nr:hypothetical protein [Planctomycetota bacterium]